MAEVKCPIYKEKVEGESSSEMSENVRSHMTIVHGMKNPTPGGIGEGAKVDTKEASYEVGTTWASTCMGKLQHGTEERGSGSEDTREISMSFECPVCERPISVRSYEELSGNFESHMMESHANEPFVTREMETIGRRA